MKFFQKKTIIIIAALIVFFGVGFWVGKMQVICKICPPENMDFSLFWETWDKLANKFVSPEKLDKDKMIYGAISGMVNSLGDPYTVFMDPSETKKFIEDASGRFEGIGIEIDIRNSQLQVVAPIEGTPAQRAGLRSGDKIVKINDTFTADLTIEKAISMIRGPRDTDVSLTILRNGWESPKEFKMKRAMIEVPSLKWEMKEGSVAYIRIYQFSEKAGSDFSKASVEILNSGAQKIILDLRDNPGGYLEVAQDIAGWFLERGQNVVIEDFSGKKEQMVNKSEGNSKLLSYPVVVLINKGSASASEILAAALKENRNVELIGEKSFGKGSVQELENLTDGSTIKITIARWLTPKGNLINEVGLEPDIKVEMTDKDFEAGKDPQLDKAIEIIKNLR